MSENTVLFALRRMGFAKEEITGHGFCAIARTLLDEVLNTRSDYIEHQLAPTQSVIQTDEPTIVLLI